MMIPYLSHPPRLTKLFGVSTRSIVAQVNPVRESPKHALGARSQIDGLNR